MKKLLFLGLFLTFLSLSIRAEAQVHTSTPGPPSNITRPDSIQDSGVYGYWTNMSEQGRAGGALLGKVIVEGEPLLWNPILISVICNGTTMQTTQTDPHGNFQITAVTKPGSTELQGDSKRQLETRYEGCTLQASFTGFHSSTVTVTQRNLRDDTNLGTLTLSRAGGREAGTAVSSTIDSAPANAVKAFDKARTELLEQKPDRAERDLKKAVEVYPSFAEAWYQLGRLQQAENSGDARNSFAKAAAAVDGRRGDRGRRIAEVHVVERDPREGGREHVPVGLDPSHGPVVRPHEPRHEGLPSRHVVGRVGDLVLARVASHLDLREVKDLARLLKIVFFVLLDDLLREHRALGLER